MKEPTEVFARHKRAIKGSKVMYEQMLGPLMWMGVGGFIVAAIAGAAIFWFFWKMTFRG